MNTQPPSALHPPSDADTTADDAHLLEAARAGDLAAVEQLYAQYRHRALGLASRYAHHEYSAEDLAADAIARMLRALARGEGPRTSVVGYLAVTIRNLAAGAARRRAHAAHPHTIQPDALLAVVADADDSDGPELAVVRAENRRELGAALAKLQPSARQILEMLLVESLSVQQCATDLGLSAGATRSMSYRARKALRQHYLAMWPDSSEQSV